MVSDTFKALLDEFAAEIANGWDGILEEKPILDYVARLEANQITPEMHALYQQYAAMRFDTSDNPPYPCEYDGLEREMLYKLFALIDPERWIGKE